MRDVAGGLWGSGVEFRMAQGAEIVDHDADSYKMRVSIPSDEHGYFRATVSELSTGLSG
ncbi:hypothetical protein AB0B66_42655 [Catellatospora sp. NPDC049111]|uniref:hypothetical protein n=1 Tax=Catellatospora sp. NPDC049111 TaxID=3155271 RepID=UPI0033F885F8